MATGRIIQKAFNAGYLIEKHLPHLSKTLVKGFQDKSDPFAEGFIAGSKECVKERTVGKSKFMERLKGNLGKPATPKPSKERGDKEIEMDI